MRFFLFVAWTWLLIIIFVDTFSIHERAGLAKALRSRRSVQAVVENQHLTEVATSRPTTPRRPRERTLAKCASVGKGLLDQGGLPCHRASRP